MNTNIIFRCRREYHAGELAFDGVAEQPSLRLRSDKDHWPEIGPVAVGHPHKITGRLEMILGCKRVANRSPT